VRVVAGDEDEAVCADRRGGDGDLARACCGIIEWPKVASASARHGPDGPFYTINTAEAVQPTRLDINWRRRFERHLPWVSPDAFFKNVGSVLGFTLTLITYFILKIKIMKNLNIISKLYYIIFFYNFSF
jgi:hypothetical protein